MVGQGRVARSFMIVKPSSLFSEFLFFFQPARNFPDYSNRKASIGSRQFERCRVQQLRNYATVSATLRGFAQGYWFRRVRQLRLQVCSRKTKAEIVGSLPIACTQSPKSQVNEGLSANGTARGLRYTRMRCLAEREIDG